MPDNDVRKWFGFRADSMIWLCVAAVFFVISGYLMLVVTHVDRHPAQRGVAVFVYGPQVQSMDGGSKATTINGPDFAFSAEDTSLKLVIASIDPNDIKHISIGPFLRDRASDVKCTRNYFLAGSVDLKKASERTAAEEQRIVQGLRRASILEAIFFVPASALLMILVTPLFLPTLFEKHNGPPLQAVVGVISYGFPFATIQRLVREAALKTLKFYADVATEELKKADDEQEQMTTAIKKSKQQDDE